MSLEIYCSNDSQEVPQVPLDCQDPSVDTTQHHLDRSRHRLDNLDNREEVSLDKTYAQSSKNQSLDDNIMGIFNNNICIPMP